MLLIHERNTDLILRMIERIKSTMSAARLAGILRSPDAICPKRLDEEVCRVTRCNFVATSLGTSSTGM